jgi:hypothetical protein
MSFRLCYVRRAAPAVNVLGRRLWSYLYVPSARATRGNPFGERSSAWSSVRFPAPLLDRLTNGLEPYPTSPSWRPTAPGAGGRFPMRWVAIGALAVIAALALRRRSRAGAARPVA